MSFLWIVTPIGILINLVLVGTLIFIERRNPSTTWAWLLVFILLPGIGFVIYVFLGQNLSKQKIFNKKIISDKKRKEFIANVETSYEDFDDQVKDYVDLIKMNMSSSGAVYTQNNDVQAFIEGKEKFDALLRDIENAKEFIHIEYYIIQNDELGKKLLDLLTRKASEGVEVKLLYDAMGSSKLTKSLLLPLKSAGGRVATFFPAVLPHINTRVNFRNHRKLVIVDGKYGFIGGFNVGDEYLGLNKKIGYWRDTHLRICGDAVNCIEERFLLDWCYAANETMDACEKYFTKKEQVGTIGIQIVASGPDSTKQNIKNGYLKMINNAKKRVFIQTPYFIPDESILEALKISALSGVDVRVMMPGKPDHAFVMWAANSYVGELLKSGVKVYYYNKGFLHAKTMTADGLVSSIGTANMDIRSFKLNFEVNAFIFDHNVSSNLEEIFEKDMNDSSNITLKMYENRSRGLRIKESVARLVSPIL